MNHLGTESLYSEDLPLKFKHSLAQLMDATEFPLDCFHALDVYYHGVAVRFMIQNPGMYRELKSKLPMEWSVTDGHDKPELTLKWIDASLFVSNPEDFEFDPNPDYRYGEVNGKQSIYQRDMIAIEESENYWTIMTLPEVTDGFDNVLRMLLPYYLLKRKSLVMHSCCVIGKDGYAHVFLGLSNHGKSTTASLSGDRLVTGDDINVYHVKEDGVYVGSALMGGNPEYKAPFENMYKVKDFHWLFKDSSTWKNKHDEKRLALRLMQSVFMWAPQNVMPYTIEEVMDVVREYSTHVDGYELHFEKNNNFWDLIDKGVSNGTTTTILEEK